ncbi:hypothetical protein ENBRE01_3414 [Enteropsectra breve]|nr:hypothetical protein ENBRE01_3414 [Enteropsectra breve]
MLQPKDAGIIMNFTLNYRRALDIDLIRSTDAKQEFVVNVYDAIQMITDAWIKVKTVKYENQGFFLKMRPESENRAFLENRAGMKKSGNTMKGRLRMNINKC